MHSDATALEEINLYFNTQPLQTDVSAADHCPDAIARHAVAWVRLKLGSPLCRERGQLTSVMKYQQSRHEGATTAYLWECNFVQTGAGKFG